MSSTPVTHNRRIQKVAVIGFEGFLQDYTITHFRMPRIGPLIMSTILRDVGYEVKMFAEGVKFFDKSDLNYICSVDLVAISVLTYGANRAYAMTSLIKTRNPNSIILMGDVHPTIMPNHALQHCDFVIRGEGDETLIELLAYLNQEPGHKKLPEIPGLSFWEDNNIIHNENRKRPKNIEVIPDHSLIESFYQEIGWKSLRKGRMTMAVVQASRGCPVACKFCLGSAILGKEYRTREIESVITNLKEIKKKSKGIKLTVFFIDNHFFIDKRWTKQLLKRIIQEKLKFKFIAFGQYFIGKDKEMLSLLRDAGFVRIFVGFESINPSTLKEFNKRQSESSMRDCIAAMHEYGVHIHGSFMLGGETDTLETIDATIKFAIETDIMTASFFGLCEYPFENHNFVPTTNCLPQKRLLPKKNLDFYNLNFVSIYPKMVKPSQLQLGLIRAHEEFFSLKRVRQSILKGDHRRVFGRLIGYWAQRKMVSQMKAYLPYLEEMEEGKYTNQNQLIEENIEDNPFNFINDYPNLYNDLCGLPSDKICFPKEINQVFVNS